MITLGVLALQGSFKEHLEMLSKFPEIHAMEVRSREELEQVSGIILPGGESTTLGKLLKEFKLSEILVKRIRAGLPVWGTCAGMILLVKEIVGESQQHLGLMDISVKRNAFGGQLESFVKFQYIPEVSKKEIPMVFIRAPWVEKVSQKSLILSKLDEKIVAVRQDNILATAFHPELTEDLSFHRYFLDIVMKGQ